MFPLRSPSSRSPSRPNRMTIRVDAQLSPQIARWIGAHFDVEALALRDIGLRDAEDMEVFRAAASANVVIMTKDSDFVDLVEARGSPPQVLWITCGNTSNAALRAILL